MSVHIVYEVKLLLYSFFAGAGLMVVYDLFRAFRIVLNHKPFFTGIEDMAYWIYASLVAFWLLYTQNDGGLRAYVITGIFAGMLLYDRLISRFFLKLLKNLKKYLKIKLYHCTRGRKKKA